MLFVKPNKPISSVSGTKKKKSCTHRIYDQVWMSSSTAADETTIIHNWSRS